MKRLMIVTAIAAVSMTAAINAQTVKPVSPRPAVVRPAAQTTASANDEILTLARAGMGDDIIVAKVTAMLADKAKFDTSAAALVKLKEAGVSQRVIAMMLGIPPPSASNAAPSASPAAVASPAPVQQRIEVSIGQTSTQSFAGKEAGIYLETQTGQVQLEPAVFNGGKTGGKFLSGITGLAKASIKAVVRSEKASQRVQTAIPIFWFYFENRGAGLSNTGAFTGFMNGASSPNEFVLARMKVERNERSLVTSESWAFSDRSGVRSKDTVDIKVEKIGTGVYKVMPQTPLTAGEYSFFYAAGTVDHNGNGKLFDFGVDPGSPASR